MKGEELLNSQYSRLEFTPASCIENLDFTSGLGFFSTLISAPRNSMILERMKWGG